MAQKIALCWPTWSQSGHSDSGVTPALFLESGHSGGPHFTMWSSNDPCTDFRGWLWNDRPQSFGLVKPGEKGGVFDREFLRVWPTGVRIATDRVAFVGTVGAEARADWQLVPQPLPAFNQTLGELERQLQQLGLANQVKDIAYPGDQTPKSADQLRSGSDRVRLIELAPGC